ncbi:hypothetical protein BXZ70DRAFT_928500 [Cristinia sonorae]|uniref:BRCA2 OB1 domain-containing protein n=1 Tax=Cristinia sonorae TaxID=1940300 RepID=A0A8K0USH5_9AGAR|nr:hypothetical protein BXZ70DRAFT_928500 [Cristinia sonorae]
MASIVTASPQKPHRRKRQRLSSPTYDDQVVLSQQEIDAFEQLDKALSQTQRKSQSPLKPSQSVHMIDKLKRDQAIAAALGLKNLEPEGDQDEEAVDRPPSPSDAYVRKENRHPRASLTDASTGRTPVSRSPKSSKSPRSPAKSPHSKKRLPGISTTLQLARTPSPVEAVTFSNDPSVFENDSWFESTTIPEDAIFTTFTTAKVVKAKTDEAPDPALNISAQPATMVGFKSAKAVALEVRSVPTDQDDANTSSGASEPQLSPTDQGTIAFRSAPSTLFKPASAILTSEIQSAFEPASVLETPQFIGFKTANNATFAPSEKALQLAAQKMKEWERDFDLEFEETPFQAEEPFSRVEDTLSLDLAAAADTLSSQQSQDRGPDSPTPVRFSTFKQPMLPVSISLPSIQTSKKPFRSPLLSTTVAKPFRVPLASTSTSTSSYVASPLNPNRPPVSEGTIATATPSHLPTPVTATTNLPLLNVTPQKKTLGITPRRTNGKSRFVTPFKPGMKPGEPGRAQLEQKSPEKAKDVISPYRGKGKGRETNPFLAEPPPNRKIPLSESKWVPQQHTSKDLESMDINIAELKLITPQTALYYAFHSATPNPYTASQLPGIAATLGTSAALAELLARGCTLATKGWVENHWALVLWKLAGMVCLAPEDEKNPAKKRWCWSEVIRQLQYRYERDLNSTSRPPIRLITTRDTPPTAPMVLCVSNIIWPNEDGAEDNSSVPELEVTDGWYRIRAQLDTCLVKAVRKSRIRIGGKLATVGARLSSDSKDPAEPLEAYSTTTLCLTGNSTHLAPWYAKLGFQRHPFIATLRSLSPDGGVVAIADLVIEKEYPVAYLEFVEVDGKMTREGPRNEKDEMVCQDQWRKRREDAASKLRYDLERKALSWFNCADRLEQKAGSGFRPVDDPPETIDNLLMELEDSVPTPASISTTSSIPVAANEIIKSASVHEAGWLARAIRAKVEKDRENLIDNMERELNQSCPPRQVRSFRVLVVHSHVPPSSSRTHTRRAQLTVWDIDQLQMEEGESEGIKPGQRFMVTNLVPTQMRSWTGVEGDGYVFLSTRRDSRWVRLPKG